MAFFSPPDEENRHLGSESADNKALPDKRATISSGEIRRIGAQIAPFVALARHGA